MAYQTVVGVDVSKATLDVHVLPQKKSQRFDNTEEEAGRLAEYVKTLTDPVVVLEATGRLEVTVLRGLTLARVPASVVNPRHVRNFARADGQLAKTDTIDARVLAMFGQSMRLRIAAPLDEELSWRRSWLAGARW